MKETYKGVLGLMLVLGGGLAYDGGSSDSISNPVQTVVGSGNIVQ